MVKILGIFNGKDTLWDIEKPCVKSESHLFNGPSSIVTRPGKREQKTNWKDPPCY